MKLKLFAVTLGLGMLAQAGTVTTTLNLTIASSLPTFDDYLLFYSGGVAAAYSLGTLPATTNLPGGVLSASYTVPGSFTSGYVTAIGLASASDVVVALGSGISSSTIASGWSSIFLASESTIATDLATGNTAALLAFLTSEYANNSADFIAYSGTPGTGTVAEFSGVAIGSLTVNSRSAVPEPSTGVLVGFAFLAVVLAGTVRREVRECRVAVDFSVNLTTGTSGAAGFNYIDTNFDEAPEPSTFILLAAKYGKSRLTAFL